MHEAARVNGFVCGADLRRCSLTALAPKVGFAHRMRYIIVYVAKHMPRGWHV